MAATSAQLPSTEDDEAWLYGDENKAPKNDDSRVTENGNTNENKSAGESMEIGKEPGKKDDKEEGEMSGEEKEEEDDSDDDDDDVQVTIGDIKTWTATETPRNLFKGGTAYQKSGTGATSAPKSAAGKGLDIEAQGTINGVPVYEFDLSSLKTEDKPWNKPGADITDYFNYGFTEETWELYCEKHNRLRAENHAPLGPKTSSHSSGGTRDKRDKDSNQIGSSIPTTSQVAKRHSSGAPARKMSGTIDVIGSTARSSRRPGDHESADDYRKYNQTTSVPPPGVPDYSMPPPGMPPPNVPPPGVPPAGVPPPPGVAITGASYVGTDPYDPYYGTVTADRTQPPPSFTVPTYNYDTPHNSYGVTYTEPHHPSWESGYEERWRHRELSPETDLYSRERDAYRRDRDRDRDRERERDRESHRERGRDRERDRDRRDRSRSGDRDSSKHRTRRKKEDELDHHKSKHRSKSKKKRDKDDPDASQPDDNESKD